MNAVCARRGVTLGVCHGLLEPLPNAIRCFAHRLDLRYVSTNSFVSPRKTLRSRWLAVSCQWPPERRWSGGATFVVVVQAAEV
jgi:hypothetical protein